LDLERKIATDHDIFVADMAGAPRIAARRIKRFGDAFYFEALINGSMLCYSFLVRAYTG
jgi:hypothetical protein